MQGLKICALSWGPESGTGLLRSAPMHEKGGGSWTSFSMKIPTPHHQPPQQRTQIHQFVRDQMAHLALSLPGANHAEQRRSQNLLALPLYQVWPDDDVDGAGLVLDRGEDRAAGPTSRLRPNPYGGWTRSSRPAGFYSSSSGLRSRWSYGSPPCSGQQPVDSRARGSL